MIERAPAITGPWITINRQCPSFPDMIEYIDTDPPAGSAFYRMRRTGEPW